ncbi:homeobox-leucine zipper protein HOX20-like [Canna indica]|uniref:Homeobox-leucine zipper protein n=1 Tax=Canna indica TaxID=4628 RepID=A0AAQ3Q9K6_9LILI|nr:homeobox-leucine zipper protein HOX20-like [Canna indica]
MKEDCKHKNTMKRLSSNSSKSIEEAAVNLVPVSSVEENEKHDEERNQFLLLDGMEEMESCDEDLCSNYGCSSSLGQKKRRLSVDQVKALEKDFEKENKLDPERKVRLAQELGLRPRQIAIWFQNRRARWKTKQLERDFDALKACHTALKFDVDSLRGEKEALISEVKELKTKLADSAMARIAEDKVVEEEGVGVFKDGNTDSTDSSMVLSSGGGRAYSERIMSHCSSFLFECHRVVELYDKSYLEDESLLSGDEFCGSLFSEEHPPNLSW